MRGFEHVGFVDVGYVRPGGFEAGAGDLFDLWDVVDVRVERVVVGVFVFVVVQVVCELVDD